MRSLGPGALFLGALILLGALQVVDLQITEASFRQGSNYGEVYFEPDRVVQAMSVRVQPGERLLAHPEVPGASPWIFSSYDFHIAPGGARYAFASGAAPEVYHSETGIALSPCCHGGIVAFERPRAGSLDPPAIETVPQERRQEFEVVSADDLLDLVWVFHYRPDVAPPTEPEARRAFETRVYHDMSRSPPMALRDPVVWEEPILRARPIVVLLTEVGTLAAGVAAVWWVVRARRSRQLAAAAGTEGLLELHAAGGAFLARVRDLLLALLAFALLLVVYTSVAFERARRPDAAEAWLVSQFTPHVGDPLAWLYFPVVGAAAYALWHVHRALARWRRRAAVPPLDL